MIADDHPIFKEGLHLLLRHFPHLHVIGEAADGAALLKLIENEAPDVVLTDIEMPVMNGLEVTKAIRERYPEIKIIVLTQFEDVQLVDELVEDGVSGYLRKKADKEEIAEAIQTVYEGENYFCSSTTMALAKIVAAKTKNIKKQEQVHFNDSELEIIKLICGEYASKNIADATNLAKRTVEKYRNQIMEKTGAKNVVGIVIYAIRNGIYKP